MDEENILFAINEKKEKKREIYHFQNRDGKIYIKLFLFTAIIGVCTL